MNIYIGTYTKRSSRGIYALTLNTETKTLGKPAVYACVENPTYLTLAEDGVLCTLKAEDKGGIAYIVEGKTVNHILRDTTAPCFVSYVPTKKLAFSANYHQGSLEVFRFSPKVGLTHLQRVQHGEGSHLHFVLYNERFDEVHVCDLGLDEVDTYRIDETGRLQLKHRFQTAKGQGPRHLVVHPTLPILYVFTELSSEVLVLRRHEEALELLQTISSLPEGEDGLKSGAAIRISNDGRFVYVSNRGHDSISVFSVAEEGTLTLIQNISSYGKHPRDFAASNDQRFIVVANMESDSLSLFERDRETGKLRLIQFDVHVPEPVCVVFEW